jgi:hypothetical protein
LLGAEILDDTCQNEIDGALVRVLSAPSFSHP